MLFKHVDMFLFPAIIIVQVRVTCYVFLFHE